MLGVTMLVMAGHAQSWRHADDVGKGVKHWDDIPTPTSSSAEILNSLSPRESLPSPPPEAPGPTGAWYERRMLPESGALKSYFEQLVASTDEKVVKSAGLRLQLPDSEAWFTQTFGSGAAGPLEAEYSALRANWTKQFSELLQGLRGRKQTAVAVQVVRGPSDTDATADMRQAFAAMQVPTALYTVRFINPTTRQVYSMHSFAYVDGAFRYVGKLRAITGGQREEQAAPAQSNAPMAGTQGDAGGMQTSTDASRQAGDAGRYQVQYPQQRSSGMTPGTWPARGGSATPPSGSYQYPSTKRP
jgi:hypothetical protein